MPSIQVNESGAVMYYEDSDAPDNSSTYTTILIIHGLVFHGAGFAPLLKHAAAQHARVIYLNLRDYPQSSPYTSSELEGLWSNDEDKDTRALRSQGVEIAAFLTKIILTKNLPPVQEVDGKKMGGVVLLSWSLGNIWSLAMLANSEHLDTKTRDILEKQLRALVMYEPPHFPFGFRLPEEIYYPGYDISISHAQLPTAFTRWVGAFHTPLSTLTDNVHLHASRPEMHSISSDTRYISSTEQFSLDYLASITEPSVLQRSCLHIHTWKRKGAYFNAERALFRSDGSFHNMDILLLWGDMTIPLCTYSAAYVKMRYEDAVAEGSWRFAREAKFVKIEGGNHFMHLHDPEKFLKDTLGSL